MARGDDQVTTLTVTVSGRRFEPTEDRPLVFGRADIEDQVIGLDPRDMGISAVAGAIVLQWDVWWVHNRSGTRHLLLEERVGVAPRRLACGDRHAISSTEMTVLVPGSILTHRLVIEPPAGYIMRLRHTVVVSSGTTTPQQIRLSERDRDVLAALFAGYLEPWPRYNPHPVTYAAAAARLGPPWDHVRVRKQVERVRGRLAVASVFIDGPRANYELAEFLIGNGLLATDDLAQLGSRRAPERTPDSDE